MFAVFLHPLTSNACLRPATNASAATSIYRSAAACQWFYSPRMLHSPWTAQKSSNPRQLCQNPRASQWKGSSACYSHRFSPPPVSTPKVITRYCTPRHPRFSIVSWYSGEPISLSLSLALLPRVVGGCRRRHRHRCNMLSTRQNFSSLCVLLVYHSVQNHVRA